MSSQILFRSLKSGRDRIWNSHTYVRQRGSSWSHLRPYSDTDDIRDIAWSKIKPDWLSVRERENNGDFEIITYWGSSPYDEFYIENPNESRKIVIQKAKHLIHTSAQFGQYPYREYIGNTGLKDLIKMKPKNALIFLCNIEIDNTVEILGYHNDLIYLDISHPYENNADETLLFSWQVLDLNMYKKAYSAGKDAQKNIIKKIWSSYISITTKDNITTILNTFFKKRYKNG